MVSFIKILNSKTSHFIIGYEMSFRKEKDYYSMKRIKIQV